MVHGLRKFQTCVLINNQSNAIKDKDTSAPKVGHDGSAADHDHTTMDQDQSTVVKDKVTHPQTTIESESSTILITTIHLAMNQDKTTSS